MADVFDREALHRVVAEARPDVVIHQLTALGHGDLKANARLRTAGTRNLVDAALAAGVRRMVAQSIAWAYEPGDAPAGEDVPLDLAAPEPRRTSVLGVAALETAVRDLPDWVVLRYGTLYGPDTWYARGRGRLGAGLQPRGGRARAGGDAGGAARLGRGADNHHARTDLGWSPAYPSWRAGFATLG